MDQRADRQRQSARPNEPARCGDRQAGRQGEEAFVEVMLRMAHTGRAYESAVERVRSLADQMNGLINSFVAVSLAALTAAGVFVCTVELGREDPDDSRWVLMVLFFAVSAILMPLLWQAERRVANITEAFVIGMIRGKWPTDDTA